MPIANLDGGGGGDGTASFVPISVSYYNHNLIRRDDGGAHT